MTHEQFIENSIEALRKNLEFRSAQNRFFFFGEIVKCFKSGMQNESIIDGFGYNKEGNNVYHVKDKGWYMANQIEKCEPVCIANGYNNKAESIIDFNDDFCKYRLIPASSIKGELKPGQFPLGTCKDDLYYNNDDVIICAPGLFCDGMKGKVIISLELKTKVSRAIDETEVVVEFPLPEEKHGIIPQVHIIPAMYVKSFDRDSTYYEDMHVETDNNNTSEEMNTSQDPNANDKVMYAFTAPQYNQIVEELNKLSSNRTNLPNVVLASLFILNILSKQTFHVLDPVVKVEITNTENWALSAALFILKEKVPNNNFQNLFDMSMINNKSDIFSCQ